jgi:hypothetical protein
VTSILSHPLSYIAHRASHFGCYARIGCGDFRFPMTPGLSFPRAWDPQPPRISPLGRFMEAVAMKSYASPLMNGGMLILSFLAEIAVAGMLLRRRFEPLAYLTLVLALSAVTYELAFFIVGVSAAQRYVHVVVFVAGLSLPLSIAAWRNRSSAADVSAGFSGGSAALAEPRVIAMVADQRS